MFLFFYVLLIFFTSPVLQAGKPGNQSNSSEGSIEFLSEQEQQEPLSEGAKLIFEMTELNISEPPKSFSMEGFPINFIPLPSFPAIIGTSEGWNFKNGSPLFPCSFDTIKIDPDHENIFFPTMQAPLFPSKIETIHLPGKRKKIKKNAKENSNLANEAKTSKNFKKDLEKNT
ncbi:MAG: hypothetical protein BGO07_02260 [Alphaproteobacteria bacterium 40-19]|nr:MAG: hypothetical protein BGO07_02260 [Alphaproteobacteria bacterium 40-19]